MGVTNNNIHASSNGAAIPMSVSANLNNFIRQKEFKIGELAERTGFNRSTVSRHINGKLTLSREAIKIYARELHITEHQLLGIENIRIMGVTVEDSSHPGRSTDFINFVDVDSKPRLVMPAQAFSSKMICIRKIDTGDFIIVSEENMLAKKVPLETTGKKCLLKIRNSKGEIFFMLGMPWPSPGGLYLVRHAHAVAIYQEENVEVVWACPFIHTAHDALQNGWSLKE